MIYLDNAATTAVYPECNELIAFFNSERFFNPSALYGPAAEVSAAVKAARQNLLGHLGGGGSGRLIFTASGSEADNIALSCRSFKKGSRIIISMTEHAAVYNAALSLKQKGFDVEVCPTDSFGRVDLQKFGELLSPDTALVSIVHVGNETGAVNDIETVVKMSKRVNRDCIVHSDGVQAFKKIDVNVARLGVDLYSVSGHKIHAPKGVGALYVKNGINVNAFIHGGGQEGGVRSATENVSGIAAFSLAADVMDKRTIDRRLLRELKDFLTANFDVIINTPDDDINAVLSVAFAGVGGEVLLHCLERHGIIVGTGSACSSKKGGKRIADALGLAPRYSEGILRISINENTSRDEILFLQDKLRLETAGLTDGKRQ
ncbi:MAG: cysteine desulfurase [Clostridiales bacterium]|nr:cysteine desulfurase [Clostridiales bacterium]